MAHVCHKPVVFTVTTFLWGVQQGQEGREGHGQHSSTSSGVVFSAVGCCSPIWGVTMLQLMHIAVPLADSRHKLSLTVQKVYISHDNHMTIT